MRPHEPFKDSFAPLMLLGLMGLALVGTSLDASDAPAAGQPEVVALEDIEPVSEPTDDIEAVLLRFGLDVEGRREMRDTARDRTLHTATALIGVLLEAEASGEPARVRETF